MKPSNNTYAVSLVAVNPQTLFDCTWVEFKKRARVFRDEAPSLDIEMLDNTWKCLSLSYLGMHEGMWEHSAAILLQMSARCYFARVAELGVA
jgi:hypothetical protein